MRFKVLIFKYLDLPQYKSLELWVNLDLPSTID